LEMMEAWNRAILAASNDTPTTDDFVAVAKVIRGHTWVKSVRGSTTTFLINNVGEDIAQYCPSLGRLLESFFQSVFGTHLRPSDSKSGSSASPPSKLPSVSPSSTSGSIVSAGEATTSTSLSENDN
jgi:hypothetical protein